LRVLNRYPSISISLGRLLEISPAMRPRRYSAASSPLTDSPDRPCTVRFVLNVLDRGLCSSWLNACRGSEPIGDERDESGATASGAGGAGGVVGGMSAAALAFARVDRGDAARAHLARYCITGPAAGGSDDAGAAGGVLDAVMPLPVVPLYRETHANRFNIPDDPTVPLVMCGAGTGVAPMLGFLQHRQCQRAADPGLVVGETWLFFGCRSEKFDYFCKDELKRCVTARPAHVT
jgi:sulfite reductase alpha subunit-like flavoprotein